MSKVTARFYVASIERYAGSNGSGKVVLQPAYANGANKEWATATPSGRMELFVNAPGALEVFDEWRVGSTNLHITMEPVVEEEGTTSG
jgi:hypothetical protein